MKLSRQYKSSGNLPSLGFVGIFLFCIGCGIFYIKSSRQITEMQEQLLTMQEAAQENSLRTENRFKRSAVYHASNKVRRGAGDGELASSSSGGVVYTRWGSRDCPEMSNLVYWGHAAGSYYSHYGGTSETLCIDSNITYSNGRYVNGNQGAAYIYGLEFRDSSWISPLFDLSLVEGRLLQYHSPACAVCLAKGKTTQIMIPGRDVCPSGWSKEYSGYIMTSGHNDKHASSPLCIDERPQVVPGTSGSQTGSHLFMAETQCVSLLCEPFVVGREIRCIVCTL